VIRPVVPVIFWPDDLTPDPLLAGEGEGFVLIFRTLIMKQFNHLKNVLNYKN
jgi:hypothetical protein